MRDGANAVPTNKNYVSEMFTIGTLAGVNHAGVQCHGLALEEPPRWSRLTSAPSKYICFVEPRRICTPTGREYRCSSVAGRTRRSAARSDGSVGCRRPTRIRPAAGGSRIAGDWRARLRSESRSERPVGRRLRRKPEPPRRHLSAAAVPRNAFRLCPTG